MHPPAGRLAPAQAGDHAAVKVRVWVAQLPPAGGHARPRRQHRRPFQR